MKTLILVRHAKSSWEYDVSDRDRPLKKRGLNDAKLVSKEFFNRSIRPDKIFSSPANRAFSTCQIFIQTMGIPEEEVEIQEDLYDFGGHSVLNFLRSLNDDFSTVMVFGHNHAFTSMANLLGDRYIENLPTSGLVMIEFDVDSWSKITSGKSKHVIIPKELKNEI